MELTNLKRLRFSAIASVFAFGALISSAEASVHWLVPVLRTQGVAVEGQDKQAEPVYSQIVNLYYYRDIERLILSLRPDILEGGKGKATEAEPADAPPADVNESDSPRVKIIAAEYNIENYRATLASKQKELLELQAAHKKTKDELPKAQDSLKAKKRAVDNGAVELERLKLAKQNAETDRDDAKRRLDAATDENRSELEKAYISARERSDKAALAFREEEIKQENRQAELDQASTTVEGLQGKANETAEAVKAAQGTLVELNKSLKQEELKLRKAEIEDNEAYVKQRDSHPRIVAARNAGDTDVLKRVGIIGMPDRSALFVYGKKCDVLMVANLISTFDEPAPQANLHIYTLQLNLVANNRDRDRLDSSFRKVRSLLSQIQEDTEFLGACLRQEVEAEVNEAQSAHQGLYLRSLADSSAPLARMHFYSRSVREELGFPSAISTIEEARFILRNMPDPIRTTTLGQTLMILSLAAPETQRKIVGRFSKRIQDRFKDRKLGGKSFCFDDVFRRSQAILGLNVSPETPAITLSSLQESMVCSLRARIASDLFDEVFAKEMRLQEPGVLDTEKTALSKVLDVQYKFISDKYQVPRALAEAYLKDQAKYQEFALQLPLANLNAQISQANERLKKVIQAIDHDVTEQFITPRVDEIRDVIRASGLNVGEVQDFEVLTTNRLATRLDIGASAQLAAGETVNILEATQQLSQLILAGKEKTALEILKMFDAKQPEPGREIYGLTTGGLLQVTPIFEPSGQSLRFTFDFMNATRIREPNETTNPQVPRIERRTVNTDVQLSTFELRKIAAYESNFRLGVPPHQWGGIPVLNQIPILRDIPLIGWFVRKGGKAAVTQQTLIFGQTTIFPSIKDMLNDMTPLSSAAAKGGG